MSAEQPSDAIEAMAEKFRGGEDMRVSELAALSDWLATRARSYDEAMVVCDRYLGMGPTHADALTRLAGFGNRGRGES